MASRKANLAASARDSPANMPATIATPSRLMPASSARICEAPMARASQKLRLASRRSAAIASASSAARIA